MKSFNRELNKPIFIVNKDAFDKNNKDVKKKQKVLRSKLKKAEGRLNISFPNFT